MKNVKLTLIVLLFTLLTFASAYALDEPEGLASRRWRLIELNGESFPNSKAYIEIRGDPRKLVGSTGYNRVSDDVDIAAQRIRFSKISTARMYCGADDVARTESSLFRVLGNATRLKLNGPTLKLAGRGKVLARFTAEDIDIDTNSLDKNKWVLESIAGRRTFKALPYAFLNFDSKKGSIGGDTSCNLFGGEFTTTGKRLAISDIISTMRACSEDERMSVEREFLAALQRADRYTISGGRLILFKNKELLLTFRGEKK